MGWQRWLNQIIPSRRPRPAETVFAVGQRVRRNGIEAILEHVRWGEDRRSMTLRFQVNRTGTGGWRCLFCAHEVAVQDEVGYQYALASRVARSGGLLSPTRVDIILAPYPMVPNLQVTLFQVRYFPGGVQPPDVIEGPWLFHLRVPDRFPEDGEGLSSTYAEGSTGGIVAGHVLDLDSYRRRRQPILRRNPFSTCG